MHYYAPEGAHLISSHQRKKKDPKELRLMREGATNKGGGLSRCAKGSQTRRGVIALKKGRDKHINEQLNASERGHREGWGYSTERKKHK